MSKADGPTLLERLQEPFQPGEIRWRVGQVSKKGDMATLLAFIDARCVMDRLDDAVGPGGWRDSYREGAQGGQLCRIDIKIGDDWVWKEDAAENTQIEAVKGGISDAFKRAGVKWGIGRYLYRLPSRYYRIQDGWADGDAVNVSSKQKGHIGWMPRPRLPAFAMPKERKETQSEEATRRAGHDPSWTPAVQRKFNADLKSMGWSYDDIKARMMKFKPDGKKPSELTDIGREGLLEMIHAQRDPFNPEQPQ